MGESNQVSKYIYKNSAKSLITYNATTTIALSKGNGLTYHLLTTLEIHTHFGNMKSSTDRTLLLGEFSGEHFSK